MKTLNKQPLDSVKTSVFFQFDAYKPKFFDLFGYDISGKRKKLINSLIKYYELSADKNGELKKQLCNLRSSLLQSKLEQDIALGLFLNYLSSSGCNLGDIHKSLKALMNASKHIDNMKLLHSKFKEKKEKEHLNLLHKLIKCLNKKDDYAENIISSLKKWIDSKVHFINGVKNSTEKQLYQSIYNLICSEISALLFYTSKYKLDNNLDSVNDIKSMGEILENLCTEYSNIASIDDPEKFFEERSKLIQHLPTNLKKIHFDYTISSMKQINAIRVLNVLNTIQKNDISSSLLEMFKDEAIFSNFKDDINKMVQFNGSNIKWKGGFKKVCSSGAFKHFVDEIQNIAKSNKY